MGSQPEQDQSVYDYVICGGGTAGCVLAGRLAEDPGLSILLVEAGPPNEKVPASAIPPSIAQIIGTEADWNIKSEPSPQLNGRQLNLHRGRFLSGSSGTNGTLCIRGTPKDYDDWNLNGWSGQEVFKYMSKAETFHSTPWLTTKEGLHGSDGPLHTTPHVPAPISSMVLESYQSKGFPLIPDVFTTGESPHACGHAIRSIYQGVRTTAADYVTKNNKRSNVNVVTDTIVHHVVLAGDGKRKRAIGAQLQSAAGDKTLVKARKEVIVSAGAYCSPAILLRSGIGPKQELQGLGIESQVDLGGVGKNLMDHPLTFIFYEVSKPKLTTDHLIWHDGAQAESLLQYQKDQTGFFSQFAFGTFAYARLDDRLSDSELWQKAQRSGGRDPMGLSDQQPHVEMWNTECYGPKPGGDAPGNGKQAFAMVTTLFAQRSRGEVRLRSADAKDNPVVDHKHLSDPLDLLVLSEGCRLANEIVLEGAGTKDVIAGSWPHHLTHHAQRDRPEWESFVRREADTCYHPAGTCKMGKDDDSTAVLDVQLRVRGVENLRVVDASIMPTLMGGHPQMAVYAIAEKAADMIRESAKALA